MFLTPGDTARTAELVARTEAKLLALEDRVRDGRPKDPAKIGRAAQRILGPSGITGLLAGRYVLITSLTPAQASTNRIVCAYRQLLNVESRFRTLKDFLHLRPLRHWTEQRVKGHVAICVYAAVIETLINQALVAADVRDPDIDHQHLTAQRALRELGRIRKINLTVGSEGQHPIECLLHTLDVLTERLLVEPLHRLLIRVVAEHFAHEHTDQERTVPTRSGASSPSSVPRRRLR